MGAPGPHRRIPPRPSNGRTLGLPGRDSDGEEAKVVLLAEKPQDFELSEQIVVTGRMKGEEFIATDMLMKCPSKYKDEEIYIKSEESPQ